jgi:hypothetical protein
VPGGKDDRPSINTQAPFRGRRQVLNPGALGAPHARAGSTQRNRGNTARLLAAIYAGDLNLLGTLDAMKP